MGLRKFTYVDFTREQHVPVFAKTTNAIATAANTQEDYFHVGRDYFEYIQNGQNDVIFPAMRTSSEFGWTLPVDNTDGDGIELNQGIVASVTPMRFTAGTDAFYLKVNLNVTTRAGLDVLMVGFRELGAYSAITTPASHLAAYDEKAAIGIDTNAGVFSTHTSLGGSDTDTALAHAAWVNAESHTLEVYVSSARAVTYKIDGSADANAVAFTLTAGDVFVPYLALVATGGGAPGVIIKSWECGLQ